VNDRIREWIEGNPPEPVAIDRSEVVAEAYPGAANMIEAEVQALGGWVCEQHPELEFPHGDCAGPGMPRRSR
jgi:hypothetical protein